MNSVNDVVDSPKLRLHATEYYESARNALARGVDRMMVWLLGLEWIGMVGAAVILTPLTWNGSHSSIHPHVWAAVLAGPSFLFPVMFVARTAPGRRLTRHLIAVAQILVSILLIDITGGRIETHFHVFGSLAFLAFYRDWPVLITASALTAVDHVVRGIWWPRSVYGVLTVSPWRWVEHAWWVAFEDFFLIVAIRRSLGDMWDVAIHKAQLFWGANHDVLTGLPNRRMLQEHFDSRHGGEERTIFFIDLDRFKQANDTLGHAVGDELLTMIGERLISAFPPDAMVARVGGDEFVAIVNGVLGSDRALTIGSDILAAFAPSFRVGEHELLLSASIGISFYPEHGTHLLALQECADKAMYLAKSLGRNQCVVFSAEVAGREQLLREIDRDLYKALPKGQLEVYFQPLITPDHEIAGFEALLRWHHPVHGIILPSEFIPLAERSGLIAPIGEWVLEVACRHCAEWSRVATHPTGVAVNVSSLQFELEDFPDMVIAVVEQSGLDPSLLTLELTEGTLVRDMGKATRHLDRLRSAGIRISLDDFGTGYSSLSYLTTLPADTIKLDRSFLRRDSGKGSTVIESVVDLAHRLGLRVVAEGIETYDQSERMKALQCDEMQGFYFSPAVIASAALSLIESGPVAEGSELVAELA